MEFSFITTNSTYEYCCEVVECLVIYCEKTQEEALRLVNDFWKHRSVFNENDLRLHECPYYWAMCMAHHYILGDNYPDWDHDPQLWPPPKEYLEKLYGQ
jgi:thymidine kinase